jgi:hypothetical protein
MTPQEIERAVEMARSYYERYLEHPYADPNPGYLEPEIVDELAAEWNSFDERWALDGLKCRERATVYRVMLCEIASRRIALGLSLPPVLGEYVCSVLHEERKRRQARRNRGHPPKVRRDYWIAAAVGALLMEYPSLRATRNDATETASACSIVKDAIADVAGLSEKRIGEIYAAWLKSYPRPR